MHIIAEQMLELMNQVYVGLCWCVLLQEPLWAAKFKTRGWRAAVMGRASTLLSQMTRRPPRMW